MSHTLIASGISFSQPFQGLPSPPLVIRKRQGGMSGGDQRGGAETV
jgi:hypothetical protein